MSGSESLLPVLPPNVPALSSPEGKQVLSEAWKKDKSLIPGVINGTNIDRIELARRTSQLTERRNAVLSVALRGHLRELLDGDNFVSALHRAYQRFVEVPMEAGHGLDLVGDLNDEVNADWIDLLLKTLDRSPAAKTLASTTSIQERRPGLLAAPTLTDWINMVKRPEAKDRADFLRWWNQCVAIKTLAAVTAGIHSWRGLEESLLDGTYGPLGTNSTWSKSNPLLPTGQTSGGRNLHILLHAHPELCQLLAHDRQMDKRGSATWTLKFSLHNLAGGSSQGKYRTATGLSVRHIYVATFIELLHAGRSPSALRRVG